MLAHLLDAPADATPIGEDAPWWHKLATPALLTLTFLCVL